MSSLGDIQQIHSMLQEISKLLDEVDTKTDQVTQKTMGTSEGFNKLTRAASQYMIVARQLGLPLEIEKATQLFTRAIIATNQFTTTLEYAKIALAGAGPVGWLVLGASVAYTALSFYSIGNS
jgi:hypothetical protein